MRMRQKPWAETELSSNRFVFEDKPNDNWNVVFGNDNPLYVELGMGKGDFIISSAVNSPHINYIGLERQKSVCAIAARKIDSAQTENIRVLYADAEILTDFFNTDEISRIFINFCDPWPKARTAKRRLTHRNYLAVYKRILQAKGLIVFKTDNEQLFRFSVEEFVSSGFIIRDITQNLHGEPDDKYLNIMTEYERRFSEQGMNIYRVVAENSCK